MSTAVQSRRIEFRPTAISSPTHDLPRILIAQLASPGGAAPAIGITEVLPAAPLRVVAGPASGDELETLGVSRWTQDHVIGGHDAHAS